MGCNYGKTAGSILLAVFARLSLIKSPSVESQDT